MIKAFLVLLSFILITSVKPPEVKFAGALKNIMKNGDLSTHINIDTLNRKDLYGLGPVSGLKGELMILDGIVYSSRKEGDHLVNLQNKVSEAAMLVYCHVKNQKIIKLKVNIQNYAELEKLIENTAKKNGLNTELPFTFLIQTKPSMVSYHVIDWIEGTPHTMDNHHQFAYYGTFKNEEVKILGFYSKHHQSIYTHHTSFMHLHVMDLKTKSVGHLEEINHSGELILYLAN